MQASLSFLCQIQKFDGFLDLGIVAVKQRLFELSGPVMHGGWGAADDVVPFRDDLLVSRFLDLEFFNEIAPVLDDRR